MTNGDVVTKSDRRPREIDEQNVQEATYPIVDLLLGRVFVVRSGVVAFHTSTEPPTEK
jgi:hypothetical protein